MMLRNFKIGWRLLISQPTYSAVTVLGLAVGLAAFFLLFGYVNYSFDYDSYAPDNNQIYLVKSKANMFSPPLSNDSPQLPMYDVAVKSGLTTAVSFAHEIDTIAYVKDSAQKLVLRSVQEDFTQIFGIKAMAGDLRAALNRPDAIALTIKASQRLFGAENGLTVLNKTLKIDGKLYQIVALIPSLPSNVTNPYEALVGVHTEAWPTVDADTHNWHILGHGPLYMKFRPGIHPEEMERLLQDSVDKYGYGPEISTVVHGRGMKHVQDVRLIKLGDSYFDSDLSNRGERGSKWTVIGLAIAALVTLLMAAINYVNLATVLTLRRQREIGLRKVLGASVRQIIGHFISEAILVSLIATGLGLLLAWLLIF